MDGSTGGRLSEATGDRSDTERSPMACAERLLGAVRSGSNPEPYLERLAAYDHEELAVLRRDRTAALAFWLNLYNAGTQLLLDRHPEGYESPLRLVRFFRAEAIEVAGVGLSLDAIEHGILRDGRSKYGLGYLPRFPRRFERKYRLQCDPRIHFACNCGAASCPAIRAYETDQVDDQLEMATEGYLAGTVEYDAESNTATIPRVFLWYRGDFGGKRGIWELLRQYDQIPADATPRLRHRSWDWSKAADNFVE